MLGPIGRANVASQDLVRGSRIPTLHSSTSHAARTSRLDRPLSGWWCALGWLVATGIFVGLVMALGGANPTDSPESTFTTLAIGHGQLACAYPPGDASALPALISPLYPLLAGAVEALTGIGHTYAFPSQSALGPGCSTAMQHALLYGSVAILRIGFLGWVALLAGLVALTAGLWPRTLCVGAGDAPHRCCPSIGPHDTDKCVSPPRHVGHGVGARRSGRCEARVLDMGGFVARIGNNIPAVRSVGARTIWWWCRTTGGFDSQGRPSSQLRSSSSPWL
jgi:hypothetical protein